VLPQATALRSGHPALEQALPHSESQSSDRFDSTVVSDVQE
jgi:hypothetical protein